MPRVPHSTDDLAEAEDELLRAVLAGDAGALEALLDDEVTVTRTDGTLVDRDGLVEDYRSGRRRIAAIEVVGRRRVRVLEELGIVVSTLRVEGALAGVPFTSTARHTRTWRLTEGWSLVASHASAAGLPRP